MPPKEGILATKMDHTQTEKEIVGLVSKKK